MKDWKEAKLEDITLLINRGITPSYSDGGFIVINQKCIRDGKVDFAEARYSTYDKSVSSEKLLKDFDILICSTGVGTLGRVGQIKKVNDKKITVDSHVTIVRPRKNIDPLFLGYFLKRNEKLIESLAEGSTGQTELSRQRLKQISIFLPLLDEQKAVADVLSCLDDKIELLQKQNKTLEAIAQTLFKRWFVDFEFPDKEGKPYKSSGGKMAESEMGEIPEGWRTERLSEFGQIICGKTPSTSNHNFFLGDIPFIKIPDMQNQLFLINTEGSLTKLGADTQQNKYIPGDSICVSCIATVGLVGISTKTSQTNQQINSIIPKSKEYREYLYLSMADLSSYLNSIGSGGTATLNINTGIFSNLKILHPNKKIIYLFNSISGSLFDKIKANSMQMNELSKCRNTLLPKLMSGEVRVRKECIKV